MVARLMGRKNNKSMRNILSSGANRGSLQKSMQMAAHDALVNKKFMPSNLSKTPIDSRNTTSAMVSR